MQTSIDSPFISKPTLLHDNHHHHHHLHLQDDDHQHLESLSLRDLPLTTVEKTTKINHSRRSSSSSCSDPTSDFFFEFLINHDDDLITSTADDVIFHGRLLPFTHPPPRRSLSLSSVAARLTRSQLTESSSSPPESYSSIRPSRSLNYRKLHRKNRQKNEKKLRRNPSNNSGLYIDNNNNINNNSEKIIPARLPWYLIAFGLPVKIPAEMELKDIRNRQFRRRLFSDDRNSCSSSSSSASWRFLSVLSCKNHATVDVSNKAPFRNFLK